MFPNFKDLYTGIFPGIPAWVHSTHMMFVFLSRYLVLLKDQSPLASRWGDKVRASM